MSAAAALPLNHFLPSIAQANSGCPCCRYHAVRRCLIQGFIGRKPLLADGCFLVTIAQLLHLLLDVAGGEGLNQSIAATKAAGLIAQIGFLTGQTTTLSLMPLIFRQTTLRGIAVAPRSSFDRMNDFLNQHAIRPVIDQTYSFEDAHQAYQHLARGAFGKVVIKVS